jgi:hypothetical protein
MASKVGVGPSSDQLVREDGGESRRPMPEQT